MERFPNKKPPNWVVRSSNTFYNLINFVIGTIILGLVMGLVGNLVSAKIKPPYPMNIFIDEIVNAIEWIFKSYLNFIVVVLIGFILLLLRRQANQYRQGEIPKSDKQLELYYLNNMIGETEYHTLKGIPSSLIPENTKLDNVFTPLWFRPNQPMVAHPLTIDEINAATHFTDKEKERLYEAINRVWQFQEDMKPTRKIDLAELWQLLTKDKPVAVIRSYPGMGKSTLVQALILHLARYCVGQTLSKRLISYFVKYLDKLPNKSVMYLYGRPDQPLLDINIKSPIIPIFFSLGDYANRLAQGNDDSLLHYMEHSLEKWNVEGLDTFLKKCLDNGRCLILFDGLNEVIYNREQVQIEIKRFISQYSNTIKQTNTFNRFLITARNAGYNPHDFTGYLHFAIDVMEDDQIIHYLNGWYGAILSNRLHRTGIIQKQQKDEIENELEKKKKTFLAIITDDKNRSIRNLANKPLLLTLLILMHQSDYKLPMQRVELYRTITSLLLNKHQDSQGHPVISDEKALLHLGPLAYWMQENRKPLALSSEVKARLAMTLGMSTTSNIEIEHMVETFLLQISEAGGFFVHRTEADLGFSPPTFQEYFVARHMLNLMKNDPVNGIVSIVSKARCLDDLWREPFLLAVAYQSYDNPAKASNIIAELLKITDEVDIKRKAHDFCLAAMCIIEAKPFTIDDDVEKQTAELLHETYKEAFQKGDFEICSQICETLNSWLLSLRGSDSYQSPLQKLLYVNATFTLLPIITKQPSALLRIVNKHLNSGQLVIPPNSKNSQISAAPTVNSNESVNITIDQDLRLLAKTVCDELTTIGSNNNKGYKTVLEMLSLLPVSSVNEIKLVLLMVEETENEHIRQTCVAALKKANPLTTQAKDMLDAWNWACNTSLSTDYEIKRALQIMVEISFKPIYCTCVIALKTVNPSTTEAKDLIELWNWVCKTYSGVNILA